MNWGHFTMLLAAGAAAAFLLAIAVYAVHATLPCPRGFGFEVERDD